MGQKRLDLLGPHVARMALAVKQNEALNPLDILRFGTDAVMLYAYPVAHLIEQFGGFRRRCSFYFPYIPLYAGSVYL